MLMDKVHHFMHALFSSRTKVGQFEKRAEETQYNASYSYSDLLSYYTYITFMINISQE